VGLKMSTVLLIPARFASSRFHGKPLVDLAGKSLIKRCFDNTLLLGYDTFVLTDSDEVANEIPSDGTDRCISVIGTDLHYDKYINVQGDNPDPTLDAIQRTEAALDDHYVVQGYKSMTPDGQSNPSVCKMLMTNDYIHWFCRGALDYGEFALGFHGYTQEAADRWRTFTRYPEEIAEKIETLRWIQNLDTVKGVRIEDYNNIEINTPEDVDIWYSRREAFL
jgi:3-deoxy-manno-octulosonate cytidylyltransferase (CMP-KDO synthetase)